MEGNEAVDMALFARRSQTQWVAMIEPLRQELVRSLPLSWVVMNRFEADLKHVTLLEVVLTEVQVVPWHVESTRRRCRSVAKRLLQQHGSIL